MDQAAGDSGLSRPALDGKPVDTLFTIISPTTRAHLHLMSRLALVLRDAEVAAAVSRKAPRQEILQQIERAENQLATADPRISPRVNVASARSTGDGTGARE